MEGGREGGGDKGKEGGLKEGYIRGALQERDVGRGERVTTTPLEARYATRSRKGRHDGVIPTQSTLPCPVSLYPDQQHRRACTYRTCMSMPPKAQPQTVSRITPACSLMSTTPTPPPPFPLLTDPTHSNKAIPTPPYIPYPTHPSLCPNRPYPIYYCIPGALPYPTRPYTLPDSVYTLSYPTLPHPILYTLPYPTTPYRTLIQYPTRPYPKMAQ